MSTRMEMPDMSYEQELIATPVPFANRVAFLSDYVKPYAKAETIEHIAKALDVPVGRAVRMAEEVGASVYQDTNGEKRYEHFTREVIEEELEWQQLYDELDAFVTANDIAYHLAKSRKWVQEHLYGAGIYPESRIGPAGRVVSMYPKIALPMMRTILLHVPPADDWYTTTEVETLLGHTKEWIDAMVAKYDLEVEQRLSALSYRSTPHYPEHTLKVLQEISQDIQPAGNWLTKQQIAEGIGKSVSWVAVRLLEYATMAEKRLDNTSRTLLHYPPEVIRALMEEVDKLPETAGDWLTANGIAKALRVDREWVISHLGVYGERGKSRLYTGSKGSLKEAIHYPPEALDALRELRETAPALAAGWLTVNMIALRLGRSFKWVDSRIADYAEQGAMRQTEGSGTPAVHYPPSVYQELEQRSLLPGRGN